MKNLANCKPSEFLKQTNLIRKSVKNWLDVTDIMGIRKHVPDVPETATIEERKQACADQARKNLFDILDAILDKHPEETLELLALLCFIDPKHVDDYTMSDFLESFNEMVSDKNVLSFFGLLMQLGNGNISNTAKV